MRKPASLPAVASAHPPQAQTHPSEQNRRQGPSRRAARSQTPHPADFETEPAVTATAVSMASFQQSSCPSTGLDDCSLNHCFQLFQHGKTGADLSNRMHGRLSAQNGPASTARSLLESRDKQEYPQSAPCPVPASRWRRRIQAHPAGTGSSTPALLAGRPHWRWQTSPPEEKHLHMIC